MVTSDSEQEAATLPATEYVPPSVSDHLNDLYAGQSYSHHSSIPQNVMPNTADGPGTPVVLGVDEAGRGPVIGPMVYGISYLPIELQHSLLAETHRFDDSKVLTPLVRAQLMRSICSSKTDLFENVGWAVRSLSAQDISAGMFKAGGSYNLNAQAMDATISLIKDVIESGVNVAEIFVDTIGQPTVYQRKLAAIFPTCKVVVEKKADSLFPVVSAASVVAKVTRDVSCETMYQQIMVLQAAQAQAEVDRDGVATIGSAEDVTGWGSGYPSDAKCVNWLKGNLNETFGWGSENRFSWGTSKDLLDDKTRALQVQWADEEDKENAKLSQYFGTGSHNASGPQSQDQELRCWFGQGVDATTNF